MSTNVNAALRTHRRISHQRHMASVKANIASSNNIVRHSAARQVDEIGPAAAAAVAKILALP
jgi:hypothetical protein